MYETVFLPPGFIAGCVCTIVEDPAGIFTATCTAEVDHFSTYAVVSPLDTDNDGIADLFPPEQDNCPTVANTDQADSDEDGIGDLCDSPGVCPGSVAASTLQESPVYGASDLGKHLGYLLLPLGALIGLMIWRRKR